MGEKIGAGGAVCQCEWVDEEGTQGGVAGTRGPDVWGADGLSGILG